MTSKRYFYVLSGCFGLVFCLLIACAVGGNMLLEKQAKKLSDLKVENQLVEKQQTALIQAKKDVEKFDEIDKITKSVVPQDKDQAKTVREIVAIANQYNVPIKSVTFQNSTLGTAAPATTNTSAANADTATPTKATQPVVSQAKPVDGIPGVYTLEVQVASSGSVNYQDFLRFLESLEKNRRTAHVVGVNINPSDDGRLIEDFTLTLNAYLKP